MLYQNFETGQENSRGEVANVLDCDIGVSEFELQSRFYFHFHVEHLRKVWISWFPKLWVNSTNTILQQGLLGIK